jgi:hypothetical protein
MKLDFSENGRGYISLPDSNFLLFGFIRKNAKTGNIKHQTSNLSKRVISSNYFT